MPSRRGSSSLRSIVSIIAVAAVFLLFTKKAGLVASAGIAPNELFGTCLDEAWVESVEAELSISRYDGDAKGRLVRPHLRAALKAPRFQVVDPRTAKPVTPLYQSDCMPPGSKFYGADVKVDGNGNIVDPGRVNGTLVVEIKGWDSIQLTSMVFAIIVEELFGYEVSFLSIVDEDAITQRMSSTGAGTCSPVHVNMEVSTGGLRPKQYATYSNESYTAGSIGYPGREGLYTTVDFVNAGLDKNKFASRFAADFWRDYQSNEDLIGSLPVSRLKSNTEFYPPTEPTCASNKIGCKDSCSKTAACTAREAQGKECMVVAMMRDYVDKGYVEAVFDNLDIPAFFCYLGHEKLEKYAVDAQAKGEPVLFYHYEPDPFHEEFKGQLTTGTFGEHGFGKKSDNPVNVDFPYTSLQKYASTLIQDVSLVNSLVSRMFMSEIEVHELLHKFVQVTNNPGNPPVKDPVFSASCSWLRDNYAVWSLWLGRLPSCNIYYTIQHEYVGCEPNSTVFPRVVKSSWLYPNPENSSLPHNCDDGDLRSPPKPMVTSRSCEWLLANRVIWIFWIDRGRPVCDPTYYKYSVSNCDHSGSKREVTYHWLIPNATNASLSVECKGGIPLPSPVFLDCEYIPYESESFKVVAILAGVLSVVFFLAMIFVFAYRNQPIIKRSQYQFLLSLLLGGILVCGAVWSYAGKPTSTICKSRSSSLTYGFTLVFGSLLVKTLRVHRVFLSGAMKRVRLSTFTMFKTLGVFLVIDCAIVAVWNVVDPTLPKTVLEKTPQLGGRTVERVRCTSTSFIFAAILLFWKAVLLFAGLYLSFLIRKVSSDFQESVWIFASSLVVLLTSLILLHMGYLVTLPATTFYLFFAILLLVSTATMMVLMIVPKILRLSEQGMDSKASSDTTARKSSSTTSTGSNSIRKMSSSDQAPTPEPKSRVKVNVRGLFPGFLARVNSRRKPSRVQSAPIQPIAIRDS